MKPLSFLCSARVRGLVSAGLLVIVTILAALGWIFSMNALRGLSPLWFIGVRFVLAGLVLCLPAYRWLPRLTTKMIVEAMGTGALLGIAMVSWIEGLHFADNVGVGAFISSLGNILAPILGWALFGWRVGLSTWAAVAVAIAGMGAFSLSRGLSLAPTDLFFLGSALGASLNLNFNTRLASRIPILPLTALQMFAVGAVGLAFAILFEPVPGLPANSTLGWLAASVLIPTSLRFFIQVLAQSLAPLHHTALLLTLEPVWTALIAVFWLGTSFSEAQVIGSCLIFFALIVNRWDLVRGLVVRRP